MERCQWWEKLRAAKMSFDHKWFILIWTANVSIHNLNIQSFVLTEGTVRGLLRMCGSHNAINTAEIDLL